MKKIATFILVIITITQSLYSIETRTGKIFLSEFSQSVFVVKNDKTEKIQVGKTWTAGDLEMITGSNGKMSFVLSNSTSISMDQNSSCSIDRFIQEPFLLDPMSDQSIEKSISTTRIYLKGKIGVCSPRFLSTSSFKIVCGNASIILSGGKYVISSSDNILRIKSYRGTAKMVYNKTEIFDILEGKSSAFVDGKEVDYVVDPNDDDITAIACMNRSTVLFSATDEVEAIPTTTVDTPVQFTVSPSRFQD